MNQRDESGEFIWVSFGKNAMPQVENEPWLVPRLIENCLCRSLDDWPWRQQEGRIQITLDADVTRQARPCGGQVGPPVDTYNPAAAAPDLLQQRVRPC